MPSTEVGDRDSRGSLGTVRNAVTLLELLGEGPAYQQLTDLAERSGMSVPTVHRLLRSLVLADLVEQDPRSSRYSLGPELVRLSHRYLARLPILSALAPYLAQLRDLVRSTVVVQTLVRSAVVTIDRVDGPDAGLYREPHTVRNALSTASGRLLGSRAGDDEWKAMLELCPEGERSEAEASRNAWSSAPWLLVEGHPLGPPGHVAVPLVDGQGTALATLVATVAPGASAPEVEAVAGHLTRAGAAAVRTLGHA
ncbi:helix-turn-helix domain-containing protein [Intrasporangium sp. DVR]|uniref:IclR family transcriptional regulator n=1 Tax=Intrasporangium sp. DVR TaxID=3127867 RepID=UPI00313A63FC